MKWLLLVLFFPMAVTAQTIHFEDDIILYEGQVSLPGLKAEEITTRMQEAIASPVKKGTMRTSIHPDRSSVVVEGVIALNTPFHIIRNMHFTLQLRAIENGYSYRLDSVSVSEGRRGSKPKTKSSGELLEGLEETGAAGTTQEKLLNEMDLRIQKFLTQIESAMRKPMK